MSEDFLELSYKTASNIRAARIADSITAVSRRYRSFLHQKKDFLSHYDEELYISGVRSGSQIYEFVPVAIAALIPVISDANTVIQFQTHLINLLDSFRGKTEEPQKITPKVCDDAIKILEPAKFSDGGVQINAVNSSIVINNNFFSPKEAEQISSKALEKKIYLQTPDIEIVKGALFKFVQSRTGAAKTMGFNSPDKGIIPSLDTKTYSVIFDEEIEQFKFDMITGSENLFAKNYIVDAEIIKVMGKIRAYKLLSIRVA